MSIAEKLTYLQTTKQLLKTEINKINNVLDDNSTFRSYPQELFNGYLDILNNGTDTLWSNLEKVSQTGTEAALEGVETAPMKIELSGNTSQETTSGKNLFDQTTNQLFNISRITWGTNIPQIVDLLNSLNEGQYALSYKVKFDSLDSQTSGERIIGFIIANSVSGNINTRRNETIQINKIYNVEGIITITASNKGNFTNCYLYSSTSSTADYTTTYDVQLEQGSATSYEPYTGGQPSPSPDYPQEVKVVKGENVVSVSGKNLCNIVERTQVTYPNSTPVINDFNNKIIKGINYAGYSRSSDVTYTTTTSSINVTTNNNVNYGVGLTFKLKQGNYYLSFNTSSSYGKVAILNYNDNGVYQSNTQHSSSFSFTISSYTNIIIVFYNDTANQSCEFTNIQLEEGTTKTDFVPYSKTDYPINLGDIELCKINTYKDYFHKDSGKWYVHKEINKVVLDGSEQMNFQGSASTPTERTTFRWYLPTYARTDDYLSNIFIKGSSTSNRIVLVSGSDRPYISIDNLLAEINVEDDNNTKLAKFKSWLSNNNVTLYYVLATPTEEEITDETLIEQLEAISKAKSVKDKTYITQTNEDLPFILDVEAIKEYEVN